MKFALGILRLKPAGGLERDALRLAALLHERGHRVVLHTTVAPQSVPAGVELVILDRRGLSNHAAMRAFSADYAAAARGFDLVVGFQKLAGLDLLYCADWCFAARPRPSWQRLLPRYLALAALEESCFAAGSPTRIIALAAPQRDAYRQRYGTPEGRIALLPPTIMPAIRPERSPTAADRAALKARHGLPADRVAWLWVALQPMVKGLDRVFAALGERPEALLVICGADAGDPQLRRLLDRAARLGIADRVKVLGEIAGTERLGELYRAADLLVHPARLDVTGTVILEAIVNGLPVIATSLCGYSPHVTRAEAGIVLEGEFDQSAFEAALATAADAARRAAWSSNAFAYGQHADLFGGLPRAADLMEAAARKDDAAWQKLSQNELTDQAMSPA